MASFVFKRLLLILIITVLFPILLGHIQDAHSWGPYNFCYSDSLARDAIDISHLVEVVFYSHGMYEMKLANGRRVVEC